MELIALWCLCGFAAAIIAASKARSGCGWLILGFLFGPIGLLMVGFLPSLKTPVATAIRANASDDDDLVACPFCAEMIKPAAIKCRFCGSSIPHFHQPDPTPPPKSKLRQWADKHLLR